MIWDAAKSGDKALLQQCLVGATAEDLNFEKVDEEVVRHTFNIRTDGECSLLGLAGIPLLPY
jgi:hypothetical protein